MGKPQRTECRQGHAMTPENTRVKANGYTECKTCERARMARNHAQFKGGTGHRVVHSAVDKQVTP